MKQRIDKEGKQLGMVRQLSRWVFGLARRWFELSGVGGGMRGGGRVGGGGGWGGAGCYVTESRSNVLTPPLK